MFRSTIPAGRWLGVELRVHMALPALLVVAGAASILQTGQALRGIGLWLGLLLAVLLREVARALALVWNGLPPRTILLFPFGGVVALAPNPAHAASGQGMRALLGIRSLTLLSLAANVGGALLLLGFSYAVAPGVSLLARPWISLHHLLRSMVWTQVAVGAINLLPAATLPSRQLLPSRSANRRSSARAIFGLGNSLALALMLAGFVLMNFWFVLLGSLALLSAQLRAGALPDRDEAGTLPVRDGMLTAYATLSNADILSEAIKAAAASPQDVYPVLQGDLLVGAITRPTMVRALRAEGDGYVQRNMTRNMPIASPTESLRDALRRAAALGGPAFLPGFVPVVEHGRVLGILTPQALATAVEKRRRSAVVPPSTAPVAAQPMAGAEASSAHETTRP